jgi:pyrroloquinoline quinone biosynthesis protein E
MEDADRIAGARAHAQKMSAVEAARTAALPWSANIVLHRGNIERVPSLINMVREMGAIRLELAHVQFYGWAFRNRASLLPTRAQVEQARHEVEKARLIDDASMPIVYVLPDYYESRPKPCLHGWASRGLTINPRGDVLPCQAAYSIPNLQFENILEKSLSWIWSESDAFNRFRGTEWLPEPCSSCDFREIDFGGCRCQAALLTGDPSVTDPVCQWSPHHHLIETLTTLADPRPADLIYRSSSP